MMRMVGVMLYSDREGIMMNGRRIRFTKGWKGVVRRLCALALGVYLMAAFGGKVSAEETNPADEYVLQKTGDCGKVSGSVTYAMYGYQGSDRCKRIVISGKGEMADYEKGKAPWDDCEDIAQTLDEVVVEDGVTSIGNYSFYHKSNLRNVTVAASVKSIGDYAFCTIAQILDLYSVLDGVESIGDYAFANCGGTCGDAYVMKLPKSVTSIGKGAFYGRVTAAPQGVKLGSGVKEIGEMAFGFTYDDPEKFDEYRAKDDFTIYGYAGSTAEKYAAESGIRFEAAAGVWKEEDGALYWYEGGEKQGVKYGADGKPDPKYRGREIYDSVTDSWHWLDAVQGGAMAVSKDVYQDSLAGEWGDKVNANGEKIGKWVRYDADGYMIKGWCAGKGEDAVRIGSPAECADGSKDLYYFDLTYGTMAKGQVVVDMNSLASYVPKACYFDPETGVYDADGLQGEEIELSNGNCGKTSELVYRMLDTDGDGECDKLTISGKGEMADFSVGMPPWYSVRKSIRTVVIEDGVTSIGGGVSYGPGGAFASCENLTELTIPDSVTQIGELAFLGCRSLKTLTLPKNLTSIGSRAFSSCRGLESLTIPKGVTDIGEAAFLFCENLKRIVVPDSVTDIGSCAFGYKIDANSYSKLDGVVLCGYVGSAAEKYAEENGIGFEAAAEGWKEEEGSLYWYEGGEKQGVRYGADGRPDPDYRGREIYDPETDGWYWLDNVRGGAKAVSKEVFMPYIYQDEASFGDADIERLAAQSGDMAAQVAKAIREKSGKWVRYDADGRMYKGWYTVEGDDAKLYPDQAGNTYYYDPKTGLMAKGSVAIDGKEYLFDGKTGILQR